jgi:hypothetical protein
MGKAGNHLLIELGIIGMDDELNPAIGQSGTDGI